MTADAADVRQMFEEMYRMAHHPVIRAMRSRALGSPIGGTSYTTRPQVEDLVETLGLEPGVRLLDVGSGNGWPALLLAELSGCDVVLTDVPLDGLLLARQLAADLGVRPLGVAVAEGGALPFRSGSFDVVTHCDVLC